MRILYGGHFVKGHDLKQAIALRDRVKKLREKARAEAIDGVVMPDFRAEKNASDKYYRHLDRVAAKLGLPAKEGGKCYSLTVHNEIF